MSDLHGILQELGETRSKARAAELIAEVERRFAGEPKSPTEMTCEWCGEAFTTTRPDKGRFCSDRCRVAAHRAKAAR